MGSHAAGVAHDRAQRERGLNETPDGFPSGSHWRQKFLHNELHATTMTRVSSSGSRVPALKNRAQRRPSYEGTPTASERRLFFLSLVGLILIAVVAVILSLWR